MTNTKAHRQMNTRPDQCLHRNIHTTDQHGPHRMIDIVDDQSELVFKVRYADNQSELIFKNATDVQNLCVRPGFPVVLLGRICESKYDALRGDDTPPV
jgi:hypothetical protein